MYSHYRIRIFVSHFVGVFIYAGTMNRPLRLLTDCQLRVEHSAKHQRSPTKWGANIPPGVGTDSSRPYPNITKYTYSHYQICVFTLLNTYIHFTEYVHLHYRTRISTLSHTHIRPPFRGCFRICGHDKSAPTDANNLPFRCERIAKTLRMDCECVANTDMRAR